MANPQAPRIIEVKFNSAQEMEKAYKEQICKGGYFVASDDPAPRTTPVEVRFFLPGVSDVVAMTGEVAFAAPKSSPMPGMGAGMAIQFTKVTPQTAKVFEASITIAKAEGIETVAEPKVKKASSTDEGPDAIPLDGADDGPAEETGAMDRDQADEESTETDQELQKAAEDEDASVQQILARMSQMSAENLYAIIRKMPLHQKVAAAKRGNRTVRNILLQEGNKKLMIFLLQNPRMGTGEVIQMLKMTNLSQEVVQTIAKNSGWSQSEEVKFGLVNHPKTPLPLSLSLLTSLNQNSLAKIAKANSSKHQLKSKALQLLEQRRKTGG
jgi:hypothetical protein